MEGEGADFKEEGNDNEEESKEEEVLLYGLLWGRF